MFNNTCIPPEPEFERPTGDKQHEIYMPNAIPTGNAHIFHRLTLRNRTNDSSSVRKVLIFIHWWPFVVLKENQPRMWDVREYEGECGMSRDYQ